jgi:hypothetical protein
MAALPSSINNIRLVFERPTANDTNLRDGFNPAVELIALEAYVESQGGAGGQQPSGAGAIAAGSFKGWWNRWALIPSGASWLDLGTSWTWDTTGLRPAGLDEGAILEAFYGDLTGLPAIGMGKRGWFTVQSLQGVGGIDALVRAAGLDEFSGQFATGR